MWSCPCGMGRAGACVTAWSAYWLSVVGWSPMLAQITRGDGMGVLWVLLTIFGMGSLALGVRAAFMHRDAFYGEGFLWSVLVIVLGVFALRNRWYLDGDAFEIDLSRAFWFGWMADNTFNIWLQLRGLFGRHVGVVSEPGSSRIFFSQRETWERRERYAEVTMRERNPATHEESGPALSGVGSPAIDHYEAPPEILYVKEGDQFVPVKRPRREAVAIEAPSR
jgi:hypothetical protein